MDLRYLFNISVPFNKEKLKILEKILYDFFSSKNNSYVI